MTFNFGRGFTACDPNTVGGSCIAPSEATGSGQTGDAIASLLLGTGSGSSAIQMDPAMSLHAFGLYLQDQWRAMQRLTITAGLRYENQRPATERASHLTSTLFLSLSLCVSYLDCIVRQSRLMARSTSHPSIY